MKTTLRRATAFLVLVACLAACVLSFSSCADSFGGSSAILTKEELASNAEREQNDSLEFASDYFDKWDLPRFSLSKLHGLENIYVNKFVDDVGAPIEKARAVLAVFLSDYYDEIDLTDTTAVTDALIYSYVETTGDKYSIYRTAAEYKEYTTGMSGSFVGIGVTVHHYADSDIIEVYSVSEGSGAEEAGILAGDIITKVDGISVAERGYTDSVAAIKGDAGTSVDITVQRGDEELTFSVVRRKIVDKSVTYVIEGDVAYITMTGFKSNTYQQFKDAIDAAEAAGVKGIVYDLRDNPGGYLSAVTDCLDYIAPKGTTLVSFTNGYDDATTATKSHSLSLPSVVICNENTASAGELFTAGIRDFSDMGFFAATLVGTTTFGKGIMQNTYTFSDRSAITLTVAYYNPPCGVNYHGVGIEPDVLVTAAGEGDAQLDAAREAIKALINAQG